MPHPAQAAVLQEARRFNVLACGRRWGKSQLATRLVIEPAIRGYPTAYFSPTYKMLLETWRELVREVRPAISRLNDQEHRVELQGGGVVEMWSLTDPNTARGRKYKRVAIDEAALIAPLMEAWQGPIRPTLADLAGDAWIMSTPSGEGGAFHTFWTYGQPGEKHVSDWMSWQRPSHDNPYLPPDELKALEAEMDPAFYEQEILAKFVNAASITRFMPSMTLWDACKETLPPLDKREAMVLAADAGVSNDHFGLVGVTRHPDKARHDQAACRYAQEWKAPPGGQVNFRDPETEIRRLCAEFNVVQFCFDPYQLVDMAQRLRAEGIVWVSEFGQVAERLEADKMLLDLVMNKRLAHDGNEALRAAVDNADRKPDPETRKLRIVKRDASRKVDLAVALSMACYRTLNLNL